ncbi:hypothetical protein W04_2715 [Pseudoalteromonas sp. SW0106-04]|nr:hypothetical protein W04_2715 [Pseudoalteromonas sp. SW0106-04]
MVESVIIAADIQTMLLKLEKLQDVQGQLLRLGAYPNIDG